MERSGLRKAWRFVSGHRAELGAEALPEGGFSPQDAASRAPAAGPGEGAALQGRSSSRAAPAAAGMALAEGSVLTRPSSWEGSGAG